MTVVMFTKMLDRIGGLSLDAVGDELVRMGFTGADLTVRPGGYIEPDQAVEALPDAVGLLEDRGLSVPMVTTAITSATDPHTEEIFETASALDVEFLKPGYWHYDGFGSIRRQLDQCRCDLNGLYELSKQYSVTPAVHIHSGDHVTAEAPLVWDLLRGYDPQYLGAYLDPGHMTLEGGRSGWKIGMDLLQDYVKMVAVKNFGWTEQRDEDGNTTWTVEKFSLEEGIAHWDEVIEYLQAIEFEGVYSVHSEYHDVDYDELAARTERDVAYLYDLLDG